MWSVYVDYCLSLIFVYTVHNGRWCDISWLFLIDLFSFAQWPQTKGSALYGTSTWKDAVNENFRILFNIVEMSAERHLARPAERPSVCACVPQYHRTFKPIPQWTFDWHCAYLYLVVDTPVLPWPVTVALGKAPAFLVYI